MASWEGVCWLIGEGEGKEEIFPSTPSATFLQPISSPESAQHARHRAYSYRKLLFDIGSSGGPGFEKKIGVEEGRASQMGW